LDKKNPDWKHGSVSCTVDVLRMRLKRTGATLHFLWAPGAVGDDFVEVHEKDFGADDIEHVRLFALNGRQPCNVDVRLIDLRIRSAGQADTPLPTAPKTETKGWWAAGLIGALGVILSFAAAAWLLARKRRRADKTPEPPATKDEQTRLPPDGDGEMATAPISIQCSACGKNLRARAELVGKKVRCPHCGKPVLVPGAKVDEP
jgi:DNA-directed RNA polymerase subunit RPC12/RpoP